MISIVIPCFNENLIINDFIDELKNNIDQIKEETWDFILEYEIASEEELQLVTNINGYNLETLNDIIEVRSGYEDMEQYIEMEIE